MESWANIDKLLLQVCYNDDKTEKTRILNMIGAQRARIFLRMGQVANLLDLDTYKARSRRLFAMVQPSLTRPLEQRLRSIILRHMKRNTQDETGRNN